MEKQPSLKNNFLLSSAYQILLVIIPLITAPYLSRVLEADGTGLYSYTSSYATFFSLFAALGTVGYGMREIARNRNEKKTYSLLFWEIERLTVVTTILCLFAWALWCAFNHKYRIAYIILSINIFAILFDISWFYMGIERFQNIVYASAFFKVLGTISIFLFVNEKKDIYIYILIMSLTTLFSNLGMWFALPHYLEKIDKKKIKIKYHFRETLIYFIPTIATSIYTVLDKALIGLITKSEYENGYYEQATKIINMSKAITFTAINRVMGARISFLFLEKKYDEIKQRIALSIDYIMFIGIGVMFGLLGVSSRLVPWYFGQGYEQTTYLLYILSPIIVIIGISNCLGDQYYSPAGLRSKSAKYIIIGSCVNLVLNLIMIPIWKGCGAAFDSIVAEVTITTLYLKNCNAFLKLSYIISITWKKIFAGCVMLLYIKCINISVNYSFLAIIAEIIGGIVIYTLTLYYVYDKFTRENLNKIIKKIHK